MRWRKRDLLAGPSQELSSQPGAVGTAGLETSALALGQARAALEALVGLATDRLELADPVDVLCETWQQNWTALMACARGDEDAAGPQPGPRPGQRPGAAGDAGLPDGPQGQRLSSLRARPAVGPPGPLLPGLVLPHPHRPGRHPRPRGALPGVSLLSDRGTRFQSSHRVKSRIFLQDKVGILSTLVKLSHTRHEHES